jgi:uncharacterized membrane protein
VIAGIAAAVAMGFVLEPVLKMVVDKYFDEADNTIITVSFYLFIFLPSFVGGIICALIAQRKELNHLLVATVLTVIGGAIYFWDIAELIEPKNALVALMIPLGYFTGGTMAIRIKKSRQTAPPKA